MNQPKRSVLLIGFGNPGRLDDGLGPALAEAVEELGSERLGLGRLEAVTCYQLAVEHAEEAARFDAVVFADADMVGPEPFDFQPLRPKLEAAFTTHDVAPATVLGLAHRVFGAETAGYMLSIRGYQFDDFGECLSPEAKANLAEAVEFCKSQLASRISTPTEQEKPKTVQTT